MRGTLTLLLCLNSIFFGLHIYKNCSNIFYFFQLTILGQILVIINFALSVILNEVKSSLRIKLFLSQLHLVTISLQIVIVIGFWGIRLFLGRQFIDKDALVGFQYDWVAQFLSMWVHGGSLITMFIFARFQQIIDDMKKHKKIVIHLMWGLPFVIIQILHWILSGKHLYGFISHLNWPTLMIFEIVLYLIALSCDYLFTHLHGVKLHPKQQGKCISQWFEL